MTDEQLMAGAERLRQVHANAAEGLYATDIEPSLAAQEEVLARYQALFSRDSIPRLEAEDFKSFLRFDNNLHWSDLHRQGPNMTANMDALRQALMVLVDDSRPIGNRYDEAVSSVRGMGRAIATAILVVMFPKKYGVWNSTSEEGLKLLNLLPPAERNESDGQRFTKINGILNQLSQLVGVDLWTLDTLWYYLTAGDEAILHPKIAEQIREQERALRASGELPSLEKLQQYYATFRERFGPERLSGMDGEPLLRYMHGLYRDDHNTLVYWLEYKNDEEFPDIFGSITGNSALKFGVYPSTETGEWMKRGPGNKPVPISIEEAIKIARLHRDQLLQGCAILDRLPQNASDAEYRALQNDMNRMAPDVRDTAWGHKYFSLLYSDKLDDYHVAHYQRFHLIRLLRKPPAEDGRFVAAGHYVRIARYLGMPLNHLTTILNRRNGRPYRYWRFRSENTDGLDAQQIWQIMQEESCLAVGWQALGDLSDVEHNKSSKGILTERLNAIHQNDSRLRQAIFDFATDVDTPDLVAVTVDDVVAGIARVTGPYYYQPEAKVPHRRPVTWLSLESWEPPHLDARGIVLREADRSTMQLEMERCVLVMSDTQVLSRPSVDPTPPRPSHTTPAAKPGQSALAHTPLDGIPGAIQAILERKGQVILYGPPGTGKTHWAEVTATELAARHAFGRRYEDLTADERNQVFGAATSVVRLCSFHPAYGYEDFLEGYRPTEVDGSMHFVLRDGIFKQLCAQAKAQPEHNFYLIIDEINRGDIPRIFGELLTLLEKNKRGKTAILPLSGEPFTVPENLYIIGTMNTADRSIALLDAALRRRFGFLELLPEIGVLADAFVRGLPLAAWLRELNRRILEHVGRDARNLQIGHAYLLDKGRPVTEFAHFSRIVREDIIPLLEEYCYEDYERLERILGTSLVDVNAQQVRASIFTAGSEDDLIRALLEPTPELATAARTNGSSTDDVNEDGEGQDGGEDDA